MIVVEILARARGGEGVKSGPIGLAMILLLCVAVYFLFKSMSKHLKRVREGFPQDAPAQADRPAAAAGPPAPPAPAPPAPAPTERPTSAPGGDASP